MNKEIVCGSLGKGDHNLATAIRRHHKLPNQRPFVSSIGEHIALSKIGIGHEAPPASIAVTSVPVGVGEHHDSSF